MIDRNAERALAAAIALPILAFWIVRPDAGRASAGNLAFSALLFGWSIVSIAVRSDFRSTLLRSGAALGWAFLSELLGTHGLTGFPPYRYSAALGPAVLGVPLAVLLTWPPLFLLIGRLATTTAGRHRNLAPLAALLPSLALFLPLDLAGVARGLWRYEPPGPFHGTRPLALLGWAAIPIVARLIDRPLRRSDDRAELLDALLYAVLLAHQCAIASRELGTAVLVLSLGVAVPLLLPVAHRLRIASRG